MIQSVEAHSSGSLPARAIQGFVRRYVEANANPDTSRKTLQRVQVAKTFKNAFRALYDVPITTVNKAVQRAEKPPSETRKRIAQAVLAGFGAIEATGVIFHKTVAVQRIASTHRNIVYKLLGVNQKPFMTEQNSDSDIVVDGDDSSHAGDVLAQKDKFW